jgi:hypothetical protein
MINDPEEWRSHSTPINYGDNISSSYTMASEPKSIRYEPKYSLRNNEDRNINIDGHKDRNMDRNMDRGINIDGHKDRNMDRGIDIDRHRDKWHNRNNKDSTDTSCEQYIDKDYKGYGGHRSNYIYNSVYVSDTKEIQQGGYKTKILVSPLSNIKTHSCNCDGSISVYIRRKNKVISLMWETFSGFITQNGLSYIGFNQSMCPVSPYPIYKSVPISYSGKGITTIMEFNPHIEPQMRIYFNMDMQGSSKVGDTIKVYGGVIEYITE